VKGFGQVVIRTGIDAGPLSPAMYRVLSGSTPAMYDLPHAIS
jgi:hypothetical protein